MNEIIKETQSICPVCLKIVKATVIKECDDLYLTKNCEEHGFFKTVIWRGKPSYDSWKRNKSPAYPKVPYTKVEKGCPHDCGLCSDHRQHTCTVLIEVTSRCNLSCEFCFADAHGNGTDPDMGTIEMWYSRIIEAGGPYNLQISGGEPTMREDLHEIISKATNMGFKFIQLNTNGINLKDYNYYEKLKKAGLKSIFLQFNDLTGTEMTKLNTKDIIQDKLKVIENSAKLGIGVILVCTVVPNKNDNILWNIIEFGLKNAPTVRGVHFQPVSYFGRIPKLPEDKDRITLPEVISKIVQQSDDKIKLSDFAPSGCENAYCSFHANYISVDGKLITVSRKNECCGEENGKEGSKKSKRFVERNWSGVKINKYIPKKNSFEELNQKIKNGFFSISGMAFQDAWNVDTQRLKDCCIHVVSKEGNLIPFCAYNITTLDQKKLYR
ncbi:radical SAM (seleno)protein TrsS [Clostridium estertheticum]|uniref:radical SAM (seleno)protein TrsS n=1 Tax=Clostridium estertheticum TaxID=238834 RepID=UPI001C7DBEF3|nr:radical SAM (seleno)protein TrsS [Clostridium estertheticum]MBX4267672.1 radical SAM protein [Clostridium estertheticum]WLC77924.1 radical SAM protein [Clostridium estertheticum]